MVLFTKNNILKKFKDEYEIIDYFCYERYELYVNRKRYTIR